ncbi:MAG: endolytic transglycosylase MltG [Methylophilaceae bacterium]
MRQIKQLMVCMGLMLLLLIAWMIFFANSMIRLQHPTHELILKAGSSMRSVSRQLVAQKILQEPWSFTLLARISGKASEIKAGNYLIESGITPYALLNLLAQGKTIQENITFIEGWTFAQMRAAINRHEAIKHMTMAYTDQEIMHSLGAEGDAAEGLFFPDTYYFAKNMSDKDIFKRSHQAMQLKLNTAWQSRATDLPYQSPYEALILASIVEKETGKGSERPIIAGVFLNRLRIGMRLQTDPTVIYGLGEDFDGNLRKKDLLHDTVYNTYTRSGLPPTPIALPGLAAIEAVLHPAQTKALYFVGKGDGSHAFSASLAEHNRAVVRYQLKQSQ